MVPASIERSSLEGYSGGGRVVEGVVHDVANLGESEPTSAFVSLFEDGCLTRLTVT
jgi:hypothetical protein